MSRLSRSTRPLGDVMRFAVGLDGDFPPEDEALERLHDLLTETFRVWLVLLMGAVTATALLGWAKAYTAAEWTAGASACGFALGCLVMLHAKFLDRLFAIDVAERAGTFAWKLARPTVVEIPLVVTIVAVLQLATGFLDLNP